MADEVITQTRCDFYVYALLRADGTPFYVGKGRGSRCKQHLAKCDKENSPKAKIIRGMRAKGQVVGISRIADGLNEQDAFRIERETIARIGRHPSGPLWNLTDGGEGGAGRIVTPAESAARHASMVAYAATEEGQKEIAERIAKRSANPTWAASYGTAMKKRAASLTWAENVRVAGVKRMASPEWVAATPDRMERRSANPNWRAALVDAQQKRSAEYWASKGVEPTEAAIQAARREAKREADKKYHRERAQRAVAVK